MCVNSFLAKAVRNALYGPNVFHCVARQAQAGLDQVAQSVLGNASPQQPCVALAQLGKAGLPIWRQHQFREHIGVWF